MRINYRTKEKEHEKKVKNTDKKYLHHVTDDAVAEG